MTETTLKHNITLNDRKTINVSGIIEVLSATSTAINAKTSCGILVISGTNLKLKNLLSNEKNIDVEGDINKLEYKNKKSGLKLFK